jgi:cold shock CspA family protein
MRALDEGQKVSYELAPDREGRMTAVNLTAA